MSRGVRGRDARRGPGGQGGYIMVSALLAAGLLFLSGLAVVSRVTTEVKLSRKAETYERAWQAAMAGIEHCLGYLRWEAAGQAAMSNPTAGAQVCSASHDSGDAAYQVKAWAANSQQVRLLSTGTASGTSRTLGAIAFYTTNAGNLGLQAWGGGNINFSGGGTLRGDIFSAKSISVSGSFTVCGSFYAVETAHRGSNVSNGTACNVGFYRNYPLIQFPDFGVPLLKSKANMIINGDYTPNCPANPPSARTPDCDGPTVGEKVVWVKGKLTLAGGNSKALHYTGRVVYVVDGNVEVTANRTELAPNTLLQVVAASPGAEIWLSPNGNEKAVRGVFVAPEGTVRTPGTVNLYGMVFAADWNNNGTLHWQVEPGVGVCTGYGCVGTRMHITKLWEQ